MALASSLPNLYYVAMYAPPHFREHDLRRIHEIVRRHGFGTIVTHHEGQTFSTHIPFMLDADRGSNGTLLGHVARRNPHASVLGEDTESLVIFLGPHAYVSPAWYLSQETVPTYNYVAVHAYGRAHVVEEREALESMARRLVDEHEVGIGSDWDKRKMDREAATTMGGIVGFEIEIDRIEATFKLNQNRSRADQERVAEVFADSSDPRRREMSALMRENLDRHGEPHERQTDRD